MEIGPDPSTAVVLADGMKPPMVPPSKNKKKRGAMRLLQAALFMWRRRGSSKRSKAALQIEVASAASASAEMLNKVVGTMRPLHAKGGESPPHVAAGPVVVAHAQLEPADTLLLPGASPARSEQYEDVASGSSRCPSMTRPDASPSHCSSASDWAPSSFSSALNLQELLKGEEGCDTDNDDDDNDEDAENDDPDCNANGGDKMIDQKAEEFIAQFYEQMRIQNYNESVRRSARRNC